MTPEATATPAAGTATAAGAFVATGTAVPVGTATPASAEVDYFISRTGADAEWAVWIAWQLESAGYSVIVQDWDFRPGTNFIKNMREALDRARTTIAVLSPNYFKAGKYTEEEWTAALVRRDDGAIPLLPVRVAITEIPRLLKPYLYVDFVGVDQATAQRRLLDAVSRDRRSKPEEEPGFPGNEPAFPSGAETQILPARPKTAGLVQMINTPPLETDRFTDRTEQRKALRGFLGDETIRLVSITGRPGIGKTALASEVLTSIGKQPSDDGSEPDAVAGIETILFLDARTTGLGFDRLFSDVRSALDEGAASRLSDYWARQDVTLTQKVETLVATLKERRVLILLDGLEAALGPDGTVVDDGLRTFIDVCLSRRDGPRIAATSRVALNLPPEYFPEIRGVQLLLGLDLADAATLLKGFDPQGELGIANAENADLLRAVELTGGIPRALELLAGILRNDPAASLPRLLGDERVIGEQVVESLVAEGYRRLGADEQRVMEALAAFDDAVPEGAIAFVVHRWNPEIDVRAALLRLAQSYFVSADRKTGSYLIQSADRAHAYATIPDATEAGTQKQPPENLPYHRASAESAVADYYGSVRRPAEQIRSIDDLAPQIAEIRHRVRAGEFDAALETLNDIDSNYLFIWGHYAKLVELRQLLLEAPAAPKLSAANAASLGLVSQVLGLYDDALRYYERAVATAAGIGDTAAHAQYVGDLGRLYRNLGYMDKAIECSKTALAAAIEGSDRRAEGRWRDRLGLAYAFVGRLEEGLELLTQALDIAQGLRDRRGEGAALSNKGLILQIQGKQNEAENAYRESLVITNEIGDRRGDAIILGRLGFIAAGRRDYDAALQLHHEALDISVTLGDRREQSYQLLGLGRAWFGANQLDDAERLLGQSRDLDNPETGYLAGLALGLVLMRRGSNEAASAALEDAIRRCDERLSRSGDLFATRYGRATALIARAVAGSTWASSDGVARTALLAPAAEELERALKVCAAPGIVSSTVHDLDTMPVDDPGSLAPARDRLDAILEKAPAVAPVTVAMDANEAQG